MTPKEYNESIIKCTRRSQIKFIQEIKALNDSDYSPEEYGVRLAQIHDGVISRVGDEIKQITDLAKIEQAAKEAASKAKPKHAPRPVAKKAKVR